MIVEEIGRLAALTSQVNQQQQQQQEVNLLELQEILLCKHLPELLLFLLSHQAADLEAMQQDDESTAEAKPESKEVAASILALQAEQHQQESTAAQDDCQVAAKYEDGFSAFQDSCQAAMKVGCYMAKACSHIYSKSSLLCVYTVAVCTQVSAAETMLGKWIRPICQVLLFSDSWRCTAIRTE